MLLQKPRRAERRRSSCILSYPSQGEYVYITLHFSHLPDAFVQSDLRCETQSSHYATESNGE